jgi:sugar/nucleoside kinase (ribokinase family)
MRRWRNGIEAIEVTAAVLEETTLLKVNREEAELLSGRADPAEAAERLVEMGARLVAVTLGPDARCCGAPRARTRLESPPRPSTPPARAMWSPAC